LLGSLKDIDSIIKDIFNRYQQILLKKPPFNKEDFIPHTKIGWLQAPEEIILEILDY